MATQAAVKDNIIVIANHLVFSEDNVVTGFADPLITSSNKGKLHHKFSPVSAQLKVVVKNTHQYAMGVRPHTRSTSHWVEVG